MPETLRHIVLVGPMGAGKSSVGAALARRLNVGLRDSDDEVARYCGRSIPDVFSTFGEADFRALELAAVHHLLASTNQLVIATGGGAWVQEAVRRACENTPCVSVYLQTSPETSYARVRGDAGRPLLQVDDPVERLRELLEARERHYKLADIHVTTDARNHNEIVNDIVERL